MYFMEAFDRLRVFFLILVCGILPFCGNPAIFYYLYYLLLLLTVASLPLCLLQTELARFQRDCMRLRGRMI